MIPFEPSLGTAPSPVPTASVAPPALATPLAVASGVKAPTDRPGSREPAPVSLQCAVGNCRDQQANYHTGFCEAHQERFMTRVYDQTRHIGRGELA